MNVKIKYGYWGTGPSLYVIRRGARRGGVPVRARDGEKPELSKRRQAMRDYGQGATYRDARVLEATGPKPVADKTLVVNAEEMPADIFFKHVRARHPELDMETKVALLRHHHHQTHELIPYILDHIHEPAGDPLVVRESDDRLI